MKRLTAALVCAALLLHAARAAGAPAHYAHIDKLWDAGSGRVLFAQNEHEERSIASITKLMTALVAVQSGRPLEEEVTIQAQWTGIEGSSIYLRAGETVTLETLLYGLLLNSGNDAAVAVAAHCAGSVDAFVAQMNAKAAELGMEQTHFADPNGLSEQGHYSTAYDMALLARACTHDETVAKIASTKSITLGTRTFTNHNKLLWRSEGCTGMKTGYTQRAGRTLVSSAVRDGRTLVAVTLNAPNDWADHAALFDYGFAAFAPTQLCTAGEALGRIPVRGGLVPAVPVRPAQALSYPLAQGEQVRTQVDLPAAVDAPVEEGAALGALSFYLGDELIGRTDLVSCAAVRRDEAPPLGWWGRLRERLGA